MFQQSDIKAVQKTRPDLSDDQASEILGFLCDVYCDTPYEEENKKLFKVAADMIYPEAKK